MASISALPDALSVVDSRTSARTGSDAEVARCAERRLQAGPYPVLKNVICECLDGKLVLSGNVGSFYLKQIAQTLVARIPGVERVENRLEVSGGR